MEELIDARNESLWKQIQEIYTVDFKEDKEYGCYMQNNKVTFYIDQSNLSKEFFTHELLHVFLRIKGFYIGSNIKITLQKSNILNTIFCESLLEHVGNSLEHIKILPFYLNMGFEREMFLADFHTHKCTDYEVTMIKRYYKNGKKLNLGIVETYLGKVFAILTDPNPKLDYSIPKSQLKKVDPLLFSITEKLIDNWQKVDIEKGDTMGETYRPLVATYYQGLKQWLTLNKVTA